MADFTFSYRKEGCSSYSSLFPLSSFPFPFLVQQRTGEILGSYKYFRTRTSPRLTTGCLDPHSTTCMLNQYSSIYSNPPTWAQFSARCLATAGITRSAAQDKDNYEVSEVLANPGVAPISPHARHRHDKRHFLRLETLLRENFSNPPTYPEHDRTIRSYSS